MESLDILVGLITIYLTLALASTALIEAIAAWGKVRANNLRTALNQLLAGTLSTDQDKPVAFAQAFHAHPLIQALSKDANGKPSYIPAAVVGQVVEALLMSRPGATSLIAAINQLPGSAADNRIKGLLMALAHQGGNDIAAFRSALESHFDRVMERASGWFKRHQQNWSIGIAALLVCFANADTFELATRLHASPELRQKVLMQAQQVSPPPDRSGGALEEEADEATRALRQLEAVGLKFGWDRAPQGMEWILKILGLMVTTLAVSLGAPFWFDVLQRIMKLRMAGVAPAEKHAIPPDAKSSR